ncbi:MAG: hypothetical protein GF350_03710 [Chitinivibrionales bacterium]|nr:hypothetical protein [Chitinivibrionales bacterium]
MKLTIKTITAASLVAALFAGCGLNPFGSGQLGGLDLFAKVGKAVEKPAQINDDENSKQKSAEKLASQSVNNLAKRQSALKGVVSQTIEPLGGGKYKYIETVSNKVTNYDAQRKVTGTGEVVFMSTQTSIPSLGDLDTTQITDVLSWHFNGREVKLWKGEIDSLVLTVAFSSTGLDDVKPGLTTAWGKNITGDIALGQGDTAYIALDSLDDVNHTQYGEGHFFDAHTGRNNDGDPQSFDFTLSVIHQNLQEPSKPYERWEDNAGTMQFALPWGAGGDSLYFDVEFSTVNSTSPSTIDYKRVGTITDGNGVVRVKFEHYEKGIGGTGYTDYFDENGDPIGNN